MALTLLEAAKKMKGEVLRQAVIELYASSTDLLRVLPFENIEGNALKYNQEDALPGVGFRGVNEGFSESTGVINPQAEMLTIAGGDIDVDTFIVNTMGADQRTAQEAMKIKMLAHTYSHKFIKGDSMTSNKEFDGLQVRLGGNQLIAAGSASGGDPLKLSKLDEAIDAVDEPTHLLMSKALRRLLTAAGRNTGVGGYITTEKDEFGVLVTRYRELPILIADGNADVFATLGFNEANPGGGSNVGTSIYTLSLMSGKLTGLQNGAPRVRDLGEQDSKPVLRTRMEWYSAIALLHGRSASRLWGISNAAVVA